MRRKTQRYGVDKCPHTQRGNLDYNYWFYLSSCSQRLVVETRRDNPDPQVISRITKVAPAKPLLHRSSAVWDLLDILQNDGECYYRLQPRRARFHLGRGRDTGGAVPRFAYANAAICKRSRVSQRLHASITSCSNH